MEFEIVNDKRNELLHRREVEFTLTYSGATPSRTQVLGKLAAILNLNERLVVIDSLKTRFGKMELVGIARVYDNEESKSKIEREYLSTRGAPKPKEEGA
jgi:small subunit ribosomal protein S24e